MFYICTVLPTHGHILHIGENAFELKGAKYTSPALGLKINDQTFWGALYTGAAPDGTLHIQYGDEYWLGQNCDAGTYSENGISQCANCGIGHYCTGANHRSPCTYGAIACPTTSASTDQPAPDGAPINKFMTIDEVNEFMPATDFSDWRLISKCQDQKKASNLDPNTIVGTSNACASGTIGPGTYLFIARYGPNIHLNNFQDSINGNANQLANAFIIIFDHPVGYASMHGNNIFHHFVDTEHPQYENYTISATPFHDWMKNTNTTNISNLSDLPNETMLYVFELK